MCGEQSRTTIKWVFNRYPERGFQMDSCTDLGVSKVGVDVVDSAGNVQSLQTDCGNGQLAFFGLAEGDYTVYVAPLDAGGNGLVTAPAQGTVTAGPVGDNREVTVNVPVEAWIGPYDGSFLFRISWGGMSCETTDIKDQVVTLKVNGVVQSVLTDDGQMLNGADKKPCKRLTDEFPQTAKHAAFGMATLLIEGYDATDNMRFSHQFDTFVGAGISNPTLTFDVPTM
ncbi:MAG TPA: hypothetical protein VMZ53_33230 [Kofleriaceae bacterium]|nr:hypothetical protein [Kofleriaceae bacterium]